MQLKITKTVVFLAVLLGINLTQAQVFSPVKWNFSSKKISDSEAEITLKASIDKGWHVYSQNIANDGPVPTSFNFEKSNNYSLIGKVTEGKAIEEQDVNFGMLLKFFEHEAIFKQKVKLLSNKAFTIKGSLEYMCCDNTKCLPPETVEFEVKLDGASVTEETKASSPAVVTPQATAPETASPAKDSSTSPAEVKPAEKKKH